MNIRTLLCYLIGDKQAILEMASSRPALWLGFLFVISAGFAREYDGQDLYHEPWHLFVPLAASLVSSFVLFAIVYVKMIFTDANRPSYFSAYRSFLTLYWMTAPLAWLYAVPYERFLTPYQAVQENLWTLAIVSFWRVCLMVRVVSSLMGYRVVEAICLVMAFANTAAFLALEWTPIPIISIMGGVRLTESERLLANISCCLHGLIIIATPFLLIGVLLSWALGKPTWHVAENIRDQSVRPNKWLWSLSASALVVWVFILPSTQAEQRLRYRVERELKSGRIVEGLAEMSAHAPSDFPPQWSPPPLVGYGQRKPHLLDVLDIIVDQPPAPWVYDLYIEKFRNYLGATYTYRLQEIQHEAGGWEEAVHIVRLLYVLPEGPSMVMEHKDALKEWLDPNSGFPRKDIEILKAILGKD